MLEGAESILIPMNFAGFDALKKIRVEKKYRPKELDEKLRYERTRLEARILHKAKLAGVLCPFVYAVANDYIIMQKIDATTLNLIKKLDSQVFVQSAKILSKLHSLDIIHGDFTTANLMLDKTNNLYVIDFGLGFISSKKEDKAVDILTMINCLDEKNSDAFLDAYSKSLDNAHEIALRMKKIQSRARYKKRERT